MKYLNNKIATALIIASGLVSCADSDFDSGLKYEKPDDISMKEYLNQFVVLKSYEQKAEGSPFTLGVTLSAADLQTKGLAYSTLVNNFDMVDLSGSLMPATALSEIGDYEFGTLTTAADVATGGGLTVFGGNLLSNQNQRKEYNDKLIAPTEIPAESGTTVIDFEDYELGATVPMVATWTLGENTSATGVITQGDEAHGKVLTITANQGLPKIHVKLDEGKTLANCKYLLMDMKLRAGMYGAGMRIGFNNTLFDPQKNAASYGYQQNDTWKDRGIRIEFVREGDDVTAGSIAVPNSMLDLNEFDLIIGSASGDWQADIDNIKFGWENPAIKIEKTEEEKKELLTKELDTWITGMIKAGGENVTAWNVVCDPFDNAIDENSFMWRDYMGGSVESAKIAVAIARKSSEKSLQLFVLNTFYQGEGMSSTADKLIDWVSEVEANTGATDAEPTLIDGYNIRLNAIYSGNVSRQKNNEKEIAELFERLASTGKMIRISDLSVMYEDELGNFVTASDVLSGERERVGQYIAYILKQYLKLIPANQQYGVSFAGMTDVSGGSNLCPWTSGFERTEIYEGIVNGLSD